MLQIERLELCDGVHFPVVLSSTDQAFTAVLQSSRLFVQRQLVDPSISELATTRGAAAVTTRALLSGDSWRAEKAARLSRVG